MNVDEKKDDDEDDDKEEEEEELKEAAEGYKCEWISVEEVAGDPRHANRK